VSDYLPTALRAWIELVGERTRPNTRRDTSKGLPSTALVIDTETTTDAAQRLTFGSYRYYRLHQENGLELECAEEGLFYADDLGRTDPEGLACLRSYVETHRAATADGFSDELLLMTRSEFVNTVLYQEAFKKRSLVVGFNLPFDLSRLAVGWGEARGRFLRGFSLILWEYQGKDGVRQENSFRPRLAIRTLDSKRALKGFVSARAPDLIDLIPEGEEGGRPQPGYVFRGHFLDLRTLVFALTDRSHTLASACEAFGTEVEKGVVEEHGVISSGYIDYNRRDVAATAALLVKALEEYRRHPIDLQPTKAYSPASIGKAHLRAMGITPRLEISPDFPREVLGAAMASYFGGRSECRVRKVPLPVVYVDFLSMYPTVNVLMGLWRFHTAEQVTVEDRTEEVRRWVDGVSLDDCFRPETWTRLAVLVQVEPRGEILPVRAPYDSAIPNWQIGVNHLESEPRCYALADVVAAKLLSDRPPRIIKALALVPVGLQSGLRQLRLRGEVSFDPAANDLFRATIEERKGLGRRADLDPRGRDRLDRFLKVLGSATSYGITAEFRRRELPKGRTERAQVYGLGPPFDWKLTAPEDRGEYCFPPLAAIITAGARLMLAMLERCVTDLGGTYVFCDTDSMAVVATESGGLVACPGGPSRNPEDQECVRALAWREVDGIRNRLAGLNPYDSDKVPGSILEQEKENFDPDTGRRRQLWCFVISAKRYALYNLTSAGDPAFRKASEHGLGHLLNPTDPASEDRDWIRASWERLIRKAMGLPVDDPPWLDRPALFRISASSPHVLRAFDKYNEGRPYGDQVKPFNFLLSALTASFGHPQGVDPERFHLVAPWSDDPKEWRELPWVDLNSGREYRITTNDDLGTTGRVLVKTYRDVLAEFEMHPEAKSRGVA
jgi:hypothetical protein